MDKNVADLMGVAHHQVAMGNPSSDSMSTSHEVPKGGTECTVETPHCTMDSCNAKCKTEATSRKCNRLTVRCHKYPTLEKHAILLRVRKKKKWEPESPVLGCSEFMKARRLYDEAHHEPIGDCLEVRRKVVHVC
uniref:Uncharacterized protein n=1 Tax=Oryza punctata TaxID=4537 RepID=A0A0E0MJZ8_ORYPU